MFGLSVGYVPRCAGCDKALGYRFPLGYARRGVCGADCDRECQERFLERAFVRHAFLERVYIEAKCCSGRWATVRWASRGMVLGRPLACFACGGTRSVRVMTWIGRAQMRELARAEQLAGAV